MPKRHINKNLRGKKILITGANGLLGKFLFAELKKACSSVYAYRGDIREINGLSRRFDIVCHLAALNKADSVKSASLLFDVNVNGTLAVMEYCRKTGARCILASSSGVYRPCSSKRLLGEDSRIGPVIVYGTSKMLAEQVCRHYAENFGLSVIALRIFNMYGPGQEPSFLIPYIIRQLSKNKPVTLNTPKVVRDFISVSDVSRAFLLSCALERGGFTALNVGTGHGVSVYELAKRIAFHMKVRHRVSSGGAGNHRTDYVVADLRKISRLIGWWPKIMLDKGIKLLTGDYNKES